ncbi:predicted protein [Naegleria gruberi]|uniref:Predicted protein n=1 Tax=Naegleria gruberi TaxID=5762 RepID=D2UYG6_NAEGR|nr:uncharacterized protein NAEGRDRAFT_61464 [Naegleria gruberi]EFC50472.1 predicted protein [Naegleria gruberi]|eukprot:XP_002683216.1 predicted protein [Naegleria gruberi strain NEG-M]
MAIATSPKSSVLKATNTSTGATSTPPTSHTSPKRNNNNNKDGQQVLRKIYRCDSEIKRMKEQDEKQLRIERLKQVRQMAMDIAKNKTKQYAQAKEKENQSNLKVIKKAWEERKEEEIDQLQTELDYARKKAGEANRNALQFNKEFHLQQQKKHEQNKANALIAQQRFDKCVSIVKQRQVENQKKKDNLFERIEKSKNMEYPEIEPVHNGYEKLFAVPSRDLNDVVAGWNPTKKREDQGIYETTFNHQMVLEPTSPEKQTAIKVNQHVVKHFDKQAGVDVNNEQAELTLEEKKRTALQRAFSEKRFARKAAEKVRNEKFNEIIVEELERVSKIDRQLKVESIQNPSRNTLADNQYKKKKQMELERKFEELFRNRVHFADKPEEKSSYF